MRFSRIKPIDGLNIFCGILFIVLEVGLVIDYRKEFFLMQEASLFLTDFSFFKEYIEMPGCLLSYLSRFCAQFWINPCYGSILLSVVSLSVFYLVCKALNLKGGARSLAWLPLMGAITGGLSIGYLMFIVKETDYVYSLLIGISGMALVVWGYRYFRDSGKYILWFVVPIGYVFFGAYGCIGGLCAVLYAWIYQRKILWGTFLWILVVPYLFYAYIYMHISLYDAYVWCFPTLFIYNGIGVFIVPWIILIACGISVLLLTRKEHIIIPIIMCVLLPALVWKMPCREKGFRTDVAMIDAMEREDWAEVLNVYNTALCEPSRLMVMGRNMAYWKRGEAGNKLFSSLDGCRRYSEKLPIQLTLLGGEQFYYWAGYTAFAYRWAMESMVKFGLRADKLKIMAKCALVQGENALALKYLNTLSKTMFHKSWALEYMPYAEGKKKVQNSEAFQSILSLCHGDNHLDSDDGNIEFYLVDNLALSADTTIQMNELSLVANLLEKNHLKSSIRLNTYAHQHEGMVPRYYQQAELLFAFLDEREVCFINQISEENNKNFDSFLRMLEQIGDRPKQQIEPIFRKSFGQTYWYYYFFGYEINATNRKN